MKNRFTHLVLVGAVLVSATASAQRAEFKSAYDKLTAASNSQTLSKFRIDPVQCNNKPVKLGIKIWFEHADAQGNPSGQYFNPTLHKWQRNERFFVHVESCAPVTVALFQNYKDDRPAAKQRYPDDMYPNSFLPMLPGRSTRLPNQFITDNDLIDEIMSMVVVRVDSKNNLIGSGGLGGGKIEDLKPEPDPGSSSGVGGIMKGKQTALNGKINAGAMKSGEYQGNSTKFMIDATTIPESKNIEDVCFYMLGSGTTSQWQLTLHKD